MSLQHLSYDDINNIFEYLKNDELVNVIITSKKYHRFSKSIINKKKRKYDFGISCKKFLESSNNIMQWVFDQFELIAQALNQNIES
jgi:F-box domain